MGYSAAMVVSESQEFARTMCPFLLAMARQQHDVVSVAAHVPNCVECTNVATAFSKLAVSRAGRSTSQAKADAARKNGRLGGRPRRLYA